jgi:hypothetical protein
MDVWIDRLLVVSQLVKLGMADLWNWEWQCKVNWLMQWHCWKSIAAPACRWFRILGSLWLSFFETGDDTMMNKNYFAWLRIKDPGRMFLPGLCLCATAHSCEESTCSFTSVRTICSFDYKWCLNMSFHLSV